MYAHPGTGPRPDPHPLGVRHLAHSSLWALGGRAALILGSLALNALATRLLQPSDAGVFFLIVSIATALAVVAELGLHRVVVRLVAAAMATNQYGRARQVVTKVAVLALLGSVTISALLLLPPVTRGIAHAFSSTEVYASAYFIALLVVVRALSLLLAEVFRSFHDIRAASLLGGTDAHAIGALGLAFILAFVGSPVSTAAVLGVVVSGWVPGVIVGSVILGRRVRRIKGPGDVRTREILSIAWPILIMSIGHSVIQQADLWIAGVTVSTDDVALYGAALRIVGILAVPLMIVNAVLPPVISSYYVTGQRNRLERLLQTSAAAAAIPTIAAVAAFSVLSSEIMSLLFGPFYAGGGTVLAILSIGSLVSVMCGSGAMSLAMTGHERTMMVVTLGAGSAMVGGAIYLGRAMGIAGVAIAAMAGVALNNISMLIAVRRLTGMWICANPLRLRHLAGALRRAYRG
jgi:O-antigen/teichoic acid export membrane protein